MRNFFYSLFLILNLLLCSLSLVSCSKTQAFKLSGGELSSAQNIWKSLPIQYQGRVKPFDTFSREVLRKVYGKEHYKKRSAVEVLLLWLIFPDFWENTELILIEEKEIKKFLDLPVKSKHFYPSKLKSNQKLALQLVELKSLRQKGERLDSYFQNLEKLETRIILYEAVKTGFLMRFEPQKKGEAWRSLQEMTKAVDRQFKIIISKYIQLISQNVSFDLKNKDSDSTNKDSNLNAKGSTENTSPHLKNKDSDSTNKDSNLNAKGSTENTSPHLKNKDSSSKKMDKQAQLSEGKAFADFKKEMKNFQNLLFKNNNHLFKIKTEVFYNSFKPFQKAWILYLSFLLLLLLLYIFKRIHLFKYLFPIVILGFASHSLGMLLRSYIMSRPPVSNMYETVIWVPWVALIAGFVFYLRSSKLPFIAGVILSFICLFLTSLAPEILDGSLHPLEAVLRSSFWLSTHVLIITMSYSFFFLAFVLGDMALLFYLINKSQPLSLVKKMFQPIYRSLQWGVVFLAGGTILGAIWADYSWGRFWAWDPKESWALVSLLAYLALLHGRLVAWIGPFGMAVGSVMMFFLVIMAWYGVNFVLGAGLHSYGFGSGGVEYVFAFFLLHLILCVGVFLKKTQIEKNKLKS